MTLATYRAAVLAAAQRDADAISADAARAAAERTDAARAAADAAVAEARDEGTRVAEHAGARLRARARREAQRRVLESRRAAYDALRVQALAALAPGAAPAGGGPSSPPAVDALSDRLRRAAAEQLGADARVDDAPGGGIVAEADGRRVDYSLPAVVDRCIDALGARVAELWS